MKQSDIHNINIQLTMEHMEHMRIIMIMIVFLVSQLERVYDTHIYIRV